MAESILSVKGLSKNFPGVAALDDVSFDVDRGTIHALVGENGSGKSTLIKILTGLEREDAGQWELNGRRIRYLTPEEALKRGIGALHHESTLMGGLTAAENIFLGNFLAKGGILSWKSMREKAREMFRSLGIDMNPNEVVDNLPMVYRQIIEVCKAINNNCELVAMDEPSPALTDEDRDILFSVIKKLKERGITVIYITHRLEEVFEIADKVTVLRRGKHISTEQGNDIDREKLISLIVGEPALEEYPKEHTEIGEVTLKVEGLTRRRIFDNITFQGRSGEVLGIAGLTGGDKKGLVHAILGIDRIHSGKVTMFGQPARLRNLRQAIDRSTYLVAEDKSGQGLMIPLEGDKSITFVSIDGATKTNTLVSGLQQAFSKQLGGLMGMFNHSSRKESEFLTGGTRQRIVVSKWLMEDSDIIFLDEPTRGVDIGGKAEIYKDINYLAGQGKTIILISSDIREIIGVSDRILVIHNGRLLGELEQNEATEEKIISIMENEVKM